MLFPFTDIYKQIMELNFCSQFVDAICYIITGLLGTKNLFLLKRQKYQPIIFILFSIGEKGMHWNAYGNFFISHTHTHTLTRTLTRTLSLLFVEIVILPLPFRSFPLSLSLIFPSLYPLSPLYLKYNCVCCHWVLRFCGKVGTLFFNITTNEYWFATHDEPFRNNHLDEWLVEGFKNVKVKLWCCETFKIILKHDWILNPSVSLKSFSTLFFRKGIVVF